MENKKDWEELIKWEEVQKQNRIDNYKIDIGNSEEMKERYERLDGIFKPINKVGKKLKKWFRFIIVLIIILTSCIFLSFLSSIREFTNADVKAVPEKYGIEAKIYSKNVDKNENGRYILEIENNKNIKFTVKKDWGKIWDDFYANFQKYAFKNWKSEAKKNFIEEEFIDENGFLNYKNYIEVNETITIEVATEYIIDFIEYTEMWNKEYKIIKNWRQNGDEFIVPLWEIYIKVQEKRIYPYTGTYQTAN